MSNYILICTDTEAGDGKVTAARKVAISRLTASFWPLYGRTRHRREIASGDRVAIYAGGGREGGKSFHAIASVHKKIVSNRALAGKLVGLEGHVPAVEWLELTNIHHLDPCTPIAGLIPKLTFIPRNRSRWGAALMGGVRKISDDDWNEILGEIDAS